MRLRRALKLWQLRLYGVGTIVGAGVYSVIGPAAGEAGDGLWLSILVAGAAALLAALSYAELASMYPEAGAEYRYLRAAFPRWRLPAYLAGILIALNAAATVALAFGGYLQVFLADVPVTAVALALLTACTALNIAGIRESTWVGIGLICVEVAGLLLIGGLGLAAGEPGRLQFSLGDAGFGGVFAASALLFFMFIGFEDIANLAEEARQPRRTVPRALVDAVLVTTALYLLAGLGTLAAIPPSQLARSASPLSAAGAAIAPWVGSTLAVTALFATASTGLITLVSISRLLYGMARARDLPVVLARLLPGRRTPWIAALALYAGACALLPLGSVKLPASVSALGLLSVFIGIHAALIHLRLKAPARARAFRVGPSVRGVPVTAVLGIAVSLAFMTQFEARAYAVYSGALALGLALYAVHTRRRRR